MRTGRIDRLDRQIIALLQDSGRQSNSEIARRLNTSESTIRKRIDRLIDSQVIRISAVPNPLKLDYPIVAILGIHAVPSKVAQVSKALEAFPELRFIGLTTGVYDFMAEGWFRNQEDLTSFLTERLLPMEGLSRVDTSQVLRMIRYAYDWGRGPAVDTGDGEGD